NELSPPPRPFAGTRRTRHPRRLPPPPRNTRGLSPPSRRFLRGQAGCPAGVAAGPGLLYVPSGGTIPPDPPSAWGSPSPIAPSPGASPGTVPSAPRTYPVAGVGGPLLSAGFAHS